MREFSYFYFFFILEKLKIMQLKQNGWPILEHCGISLHTKNWSIWIWDAHSADWCLYTTKMYSTHSFCLAVRGACDVLCSGASDCALCIFVLARCCCVWLMHGRELCSSLGCVYYVFLCWAAGLCFCCAFRMYICVGTVVYIWFSTAQLNTIRT